MYHCEIVNYRRVVTSPKNSADHTWEYLRTQMLAIINEAEYEYHPWTLKTLVIEYPDRVKLGYSIDVKIETV